MLSESSSESSSDTEEIVKKEQPQKPVNKASTDLLAPPPKLEKSAAESLVFSEPPDIQIDALQWRDYNLSQVPLPNDNEIRLQRNDVIYIGCKPERNMEIMRMFGVDHNPYEKAVIFGANAISYYVASELEKSDSMVNCNIVEDNPKRAQKLAETLNRASVITGEMLSDVILEDAGFDSADIDIAVTDRDKDNLLISLLASKNKDAQAISLVNSRDYNVLGTNIRNNVIIDRAVITISGILNYLRRARIREAYALGRNMGEIWELRIGSDNSNLGKSVADLRLPRDSAIMLVYRNGKLINDFTDYRIMADDKVLIYVSPNDIRRIEQIFYL